MTAPTQTAQHRMYRLRTAMQLSCAVRQLRSQRLHLRRNKRRGLLLHRLRLTRMNRRGSSRLSSVRDLQQATAKTPTSMGCSLPYESYLKPSSHSTPVISTQKAMVTAVRTDSPPASDTTG